MMLFDITRVGIEASKEKEIEIIETQELRTLTKEDYEKLYTLKDDVRKTDDRIVELSQSDAWLLMQVARSEGGKTLQGQLWVMRSIYNRYVQGFGSIWEILNADNQYAVVTSGVYKNAEINENTHLALALLESGYDPTDGAIFFESTSNSNHSWHKQNLTFVEEVEGNLFYK